MLTRVRALPAAALCCYLAAVSAYAQDASVQSSTVPPANLAYVEGAVDVVHDSVTERADAPMLLTDGDLVRTKSGRAEIVFVDGSLLHLDHDGELEFLAPGRVRLLRGRVLMRVSAAASRSYFVDTPGGTVRLDARGEYGVTMDQPRGSLEVTVARGVAEIDDGTQRVIVRGGEMVSLAGVGARAFFQAFNSARWDAFAQWANDRTQGFATARSASQLPYELRPYGPLLDQYGRWDYLAPHGYVWFPAVGVGWRPYYDGSWGHTPYGWTWYGRDRWAWPTHHYGRWGFRGNLWYWIPGNVWGPAWVSWGFAPGYVSWSPLGFDGAPVLGLWPRRDHPAYAPYYSPWRAWTIIPRDRFGPRRPVRPYSIDGDRLDELTRRAMIMQKSPPAVPAGHAVTRGTLSEPGAAGNVRREGPTIQRQGDVRRPPGPFVVRPGGESAVAPAPSRRVTDAPVSEPYRPPVTGTGAAIRGAAESENDDQRRRGGVRDPRSVYGSPPPTDRPRVVAPSGPVGEPREAERSAPQGGAVERGARAGRGPATESSSSGSGSDRGGRAGEAGGRIAPRDGPRAGAPSEGGGARSRGGSSAGVPSPGSRPPSGDGGARRRPVSN